MLIKAVKKRKITLRSSRNMINQRSGFRILSLPLGFTNMMVKEFLRG